MGVNSGSPESGRALHWAVRGVRLQTIQLLLREGADINALECADEDEPVVETPLDVAYNLKLWDCAELLVSGGASSCSLLLERAAALIQAFWKLYCAAPRSAANTPEKKASLRVWAVMGVNKRHYRAVQLECEARRLGIAEPAQGWLRGGARPERAVQGSTSAASPSLAHKAKEVPAELSRAIIRLEVKKEVAQKLKSRQTSLRSTLEDAKASMDSVKNMSMEDKLKLHAKLRQALGDASKLRSDAARVKEK